MGEQESTMVDDVHLPLRSLARDALLRIPDTRGRAVVCLDGWLWITLDGDPRDIVVRAGERHVFEGPGRALVSALEPSSLLIVDLGGQLVPTARELVR
jgi:hypothetical protein